MSKTRANVLWRSLAAIIMAVLVATTLGIAGEGAESQQRGQGSATQVTSCRETLREQGEAAGVVEQLLNHSKREQVFNILEYCQQLAEQAYPKRPVDPAAVERGRALYSTYGCAFCHGKDARGGSGGPNLLRSERVLRDKKGEMIGEIVLKGVPNTAMAAFPLKPNELADLAEFLHSFQVLYMDPGRHRPTSILTGDAKAGRTYFDRVCVGCHSVSDLQGIASKYPDPQILQQTWLMPQTQLPTSATVASPGGMSVSGEVLRLDEFLVTLKLSDGTQRSFERSRDEPKVTLRDPLEGHRALLRRYSDKDIHDVTAFLATLHEEQAPHPAHTQLVGATIKKGATLESSRAARTKHDERLPPQEILHPSPDSWPTYAGDYSARRYSPLKQIDQSNVKQLTLAWSTRLLAGPNDQGPHPLIRGGEDTGALYTSAPANVRASILEVHGILYVSTPDNAWAVDAHDGTVLWHFVWKSRGGLHLGNRGLGMWGNYLYLETPDDYLISLDALTGAERWHVAIANFDEEYLATPAPIVVGNHVIVGVGLNLESPGFLQSFDPETGALQWKHYSVPMNSGDPGLETWKNLDTARHGGGAPWVPGAYDPETNLYIYGTGNPTPVYFAEPRGNGAALFTCSLVAVDVETGKMVWYYQTSPNDTHDWDSAQTPVLADIVLNGKTRKVAMTAARNGYFFVVDRLTGEHLVTSKFSDTANWAQPTLNSLGQPVRIPAKDHDIAGALVSNANQGAANWPPASYSPDYKLLYVPVAESWAMYYRTETDPRGAMALGGKEEITVDADSYLKAIDPTTGSIVWTVKYPSKGRLANGVLTTAGRLLFSGDTAGNLIARDPATGHPLWHTHLGDVSNAPETYLLDGHQFVLTAAGDMVYAFRLY